MSISTRRSPRRKNLSALLVAALNEPVYVTIDGKRRKITKREAIVPQMGNKSVEVDLRATKMGSLHESALSVTTSWTKHVRAARRMSAAPLMAAAQL